MAVVARKNAAIKFAAFTTEHLAGVLRLCEAEGWPSLPTDADRAVRALTAPGVVTVVAVADDEVVGFAQVLTDGEIQAYLCALAVDRRSRRQGIGKRLVYEALTRSGAARVDLLAESSSDHFYASFDHRTLPGFRLYSGR